MDATTWYKRAKKDYKAATFNDDHGYEDVAVFRYQQAVEKALKAVIVAKKKGLLKSHDCLVLAQRCEAPNEVQEAADTVSAFYTRNRYPDEAEVDLTDNLLNRVRESAATVMEWTKSELSKKD